MSELEEHFAGLVRMFGLPEPVREFRFCPGRKFRFDFAFPDAMVGIECDGGSWSHGRHVTGSGFERDCEKMNLATANGWRVFRFTRGMLDRDPAGCVEQVQRALEER